MNNLSISMEIKGTEFKKDLGVIPFKTKLNSEKVIVLYQVELPDLVFTSLIEV